MPTQLQIRRGTSTENDAFTGASGELTFDTTNNRVRVHDGATQGGYELKTETSGGDTLFADNEKAIFGAGSDLSIYHDGSNSYISELGTGDLRLGAVNIRIGDNTSGASYIYATQNAEVTLYHNNSPKLATTSTGVDITGTLTSDGLTVASGNQAVIGVFGTSGLQLIGQTGSDNIVGTMGSSEPLIFRTVSSERMRIDSSGNVGIGTSSPSSALHVDSSNDGPIFDSGGTGNTNHALLVRDSGNNQLLRVNNNGNVGIGTTSPAQELDVNGQVRGVDRYYFKRASDNYSLSALARWDGSTGSPLTGTAGIHTVVGSEEASSSVIFAPSNTERMRIDSSGNLLVGTTSATAQLTVNNGGNAYPSWLQNSSSIIDYPNRVISSYATSGQTATMFSFLAANEDIVGSIKSTVTSTSYNTSSDHRLKENVVDLTGATTRLKQLEPKRFNFIADADTTVDGFLAHEVQSVVPEAIHGTHNEVDAGGNPVYQGIDQSKLVPLLVATIKELEARITALENV